jgi:hypothetical protein
VRILLSPGTRPDRGTIGTRSHPLAEKRYETYLKERAEEEDLQP